MYDLGRVAAKSHSLTSCQPGVKNGRTRKTEANSGIVTDFFAVFIAVSQLYLRRIDVRN
jgi:hypothetical protein